MRLCARVHSCVCILPQNALKRDSNRKCIDLIEGHYLEVVVLFYVCMYNMNIPDFSNFDVCM